MKQSFSPHFRRCAVSMVEVMFAITFLAIALSTTVGYFASLQDVRNDSNERVLVNDIGRAIVERLVGADPRAIGNAIPPSGTVPATWSVQQVQSAGGIPLSFTDLVNAGLIDKIHRVSNLQVWIEYYRGETYTDPSTGLSDYGVMDESFVDARDFALKFANPTWTAARLLDGTLAPYLQVDDEKPFVARVRIVWNGGAGDQTQEFFVAKRRPAGT